MSTVKTVASIPQGGTGSESQADARTALGLGTVATENTVPITKGGTGLTSVGTANQVLATNAGATAIEWQDVDASDPFSVGLVENVGALKAIAFGYSSSLEESTPLYTSYYFQIGQIAQRAIGRMGFKTSTDFSLGIVNVGVWKIGSPSDNLIVKIFNSSYVQQGSAISLAASSIPAGTSWVEFDFSSQGISIGSGEQYYIEMSRSGSANSDNYYRWRSDTSASYANGDFAYSATGWDPEPYPVAFRVYSAQAGGVLCDASDLKRLNFFGFSYEAGNVGETIDLVCEGLLSGFSGLTVGEVYYLSDTPGEISDSAGSNSVKIGKALSETELLVIPPPL